MSTEGRGRESSGVGGGAGLGIGGAGVGGGGCERHRRGHESGHGQRANEHGDSKHIRRSRVTTF